MTGTSKALKRLGVAGLSTVLMTTGLAAFAATAANAAAATSVTLSPDADQAATGECNPFTATVNAGSTITVNIQEAVPTNTAAAGTAIGFCNPTTSAEGNPTAATAGPGTAGSNTTAAGTAAPPATAANSCHNTAATTTTASNVSCNSTFTDVGAPADGKIIFGVASNTAGTMTVNAFGDTNANGAQDVNESGDQSTKTWVANNPNSNTNTVSCTPTSQANPTGSTANFTCTVKDSAGNGLAGQTVHFGVSSGPQAGAPSNATCGPTESGAGGTTVGKTPTCSYSNTTNTPGHDVINVWLDTNGTPGQQAGEPSTTITNDWVTASPTTSQLTVTCSPNPTGHFTDSVTDDSTECQDPLTQKTSTLTATVVNGTPAAPVSGVLVQWNIIFNSTPVGDTDTETLSANSCLTDSSGKCSVTLTNNVPTENEDIDVEATLPRQGAGSLFAEGETYWTAPVKTDARNISVAPKTSSQTSGGSQTLEATVIDRFNNPVPGVLVDWTESGPGAFRNQNTCRTDANGKCSVEVASLQPESGDETVTATIDAPDSYGFGNRLECESAAGFSTTDKFDNYNPNGGSGTNAKGGNNPALTAPNAGNCSDNATVSWSGTAPPPHKTKISASITCFSPKRHVLKCKVVESPAKAGLLVRFKRVTASGKHSIGTDFTNSNGVAKLKLRHLKSHKVWRVMAHVYATSTTTGANTNTDGTRIK